MREADGTTVKRRYFSLGFQEVGTGGSENFFYIADHLGSIRQVVDGTGTERGRWNYDLWGNRGPNQISTNSIEADFGFTGHYQHATSELLMAPFRFYDPNLGTWISRDPIGEDGGLNLYSYVFNNPMNWVDPLGLEAVFNFTNGSRQVANSAAQFVQIASAASPGSIDSVFAYGHGGSGNQNFIRKDKNSVEGLMFFNGNVEVVDKGGKKIADLGDLLAGKFDPNGSKLFLLGGCGTASGGDNITKGVSVELPGVTAKGNPFPTWNNAYVLTPDTSFLNGRPIKINAFGF